MLVSREEGDCRSEPDTSQLGAGSQDQLVVPTMAQSTSNSTATTSSPSVAVVTSPTSDPATRRRRLSNRSKVRPSFFLLQLLYVVLGWKLSQVVFRNIS